MATMQKIVSSLWFDNEAEEAAYFYTSVFEGGTIGRITYYGKAGFERHKRLEGSVMTVEFRIAGQEFVALNGGPYFKFTEAISLIVNCDNQQEIDYYWDKLSEGGDERAQMCGWLKDKYGVSWQIVPAVLSELIARDPVKTDQVMDALLKMTRKLDIATLEAAYNR